MWKPGDAPEGHPLWAQQIELELSMVERGTDQYRSRLRKAIEMEELTRLRPYRRVMDKLVADMGKGLTTWLRNVPVAVAQQRGTTFPRAYHLIRTLDPWVLSYLTVRTVLDGLGLERIGLLSLFQKIGAEVEYEARMTKWLDEEPGLFQEVGAGLRRQQATATHRRRVNINRFNALVRKKVNWVDWTPDQREVVGNQLVSILVQCTGRFKVVPDPSRPRTGKKLPPYVLVADEELIQWLEDTLMHDQSRFPSYLPCIMPPKRWNGVREGGYYSPLIRVPRLIRFKADNEEVQGRALDQYDALAMDNVYYALDRVQETPWRINSKILQYVLAIRERDLGIAGIVRSEPDPIPPRPADMDTNEVAARQWKREAARVYGENARRFSNNIATFSTIKIAMEFEGREFYFPHMLDFRGRMYPIPVFLNPQGQDLARGLLTFGQGRPLGEHGGQWLAVHLANVWGNDKISYDDRIQWVEENEELWRRIASNPLKSREWCYRGQDAPWQSLAAILEWVRYLDSGRSQDMVSSLPIRVDGTCNGIQHLSAMMKDPVGAESVNLLPAESPRDIYQEVANDLHATLVRIEEAGGKPGSLARWWLRGFNGKIPRSFTKRQVMVLPYGGSREAFFRYIWEWLREHDPEGERFPKDDRREAVPWMTSELWLAVEGRVVSAMRCMKWLQAVAKVVADVGQPIVWTTPAGFVVRHFYGKLAAKRVTTKIDGKTYTLIKQVRTKKLSVKDQLQGIAPNFVHSMDASALMETVNILEGQDPGNPLPITCIHDAYGTVAGGMWTLHNVLREAFIKTHSEDVLAVFRNSAVRMLRDHLVAIDGEGLEAAWQKAEDLVPALPDRGELDLTLVRDADYFFA